MYGISPVIDCSLSIKYTNMWWGHFSGGSKGGAPGARSPLRTKIFSISCTFSENLAKSYVGAPLEGWRPSYGESWIRPWLEPYLLLKNRTCTHRSRGRKTLSMCLTRHLVEFPLPNLLIYLAQSSGWVTVMTRVCSSARSRLTAHSRLLTSSRFFRSQPSPAVHVHQATSPPVRIFCFNCLLSVGTSEHLNFWCHLSLVLNPR